MNRQNFPLTNLWVFVIFKAEITLIGREVMVYNLINRST